MGNKCIKELNVGSYDILKAGESIVDLNRPVEQKLNEHTLKQKTKIDDNKKHNMHNIFLGDFTNTPKRFPKMVRIFLSSTFTDFEVERNYLIENLYQNLRDICEKDYHLDFSLVDMRWGITDESTTQNKTTEICLEEIERCKVESIGPTIIAFLGYRYGNRFLQSTISFIEYREIRKELDDMKLKLKINMKYRKITPVFQLDIEDLLDHCYELDENQLPEHHYKLKSISEIVPGFQFESKNYEICSETWTEIQKILLNNIRLAVRNLYDKKVFNYTQFKSYFISVTETEIRHGIFEEENKTDKTIVFMRKFSDYHHFASEDKETTKKYLEHDDESKELLRLLNKEIKEQLPSENIHVLPQIGWFESDKLDPKNDATKGYLHTFGVQFLLKLGNLIGINYKKAKENSFNQNNSSLFEEVIHHAFFCKNLQRKFYPRDDVINKIKSYIFSDVSSPFILYGDSGSGKSSIIASIVQVLKSNESDNCIVIVRFMGTSRQSCRAYNVLRSIIEQLEYIFENKLDKESTEQKAVNDSVDLRNYLKSLLEKINKICPNQRIIIMLDSIDQLCKSDYDIKWILFELPSNIKMIYTTRPTYGGILDKIKSKLPFTEENCYELRYLYYHKSIEIIKHWLKNENMTQKNKIRQLDTNQWTIIESILKNGEIYPLLLRIMFDIVSKWPSKYSPDNEFYSCTSVKNGIKYLFGNLASIHGNMVFSRCLFYLTLFENGLSENELVDILSIDDEVLTTVFQYHEPPIRKFPFALWLRIKHDLFDYLTEKDVDDLLVLTWYHSSFMEVAKELYIDSLEASKRDEVIKNAIDYFIETWKDKPKPFDYSKKISEKKNEKGSVQVRKTRSQKIFTEIEIDGKVERKYNKRKLNELLNLVLRIEDKGYQVEIMKKHIYFDYEFMHAKAVLKELDFVINNHNIIICLYNYFESKANNNNNENIAESLLLISSIIKENYLQLQAFPNGLAHEIMSRLRNKSDLLETYDRLSIKDCSLLTTNSYLKLPNEKVRVVFFPNYDEIVYSFYFLLNKPFMFVCTINNTMSNSKLYMIDHESSKILDVMDLQDSQKDDIVLIYGIYLKVELNNNCKKINDIIGYILVQKRLYLNMSALICSLSFDNEVQSQKEIPKQSETILLNKDTLLVAFDNSIEVIQVSDMQTIDKIQFDKNILEINTNISSYIIITPEFERMEKYILVRFDDRSIELYKLGYQNKLSLFWKITNDSFVGDLRIDSSFLIDKMLLMKNEKNILNREIKMRFATIDESNVKIFTVYSNSTHDEKIIKNDEKTFVNYVFIIHFAFDVILFSCKGSRYYLYDLSTDSLVNIDYLKGFCHFISDTKFVHFNDKMAEFYELGKFATQYKIVKVYEVPFNISRELNFDNVKLIGNILLSKASDNSLVKLDINSNGIINTSKQSVDTLNVRRLFYMLDEDHVLALNEKELVIINCMRNEIVASKLLQNSQIKVSKNVYVLVNNEERILTVNWIKNENNQFKFNEIMRKEIDKCVDIRNVVLNIKSNRELIVLIENITTKKIDFLAFKPGVLSNNYVLNESKNYDSIDQIHNLVVTMKSDSIILQTPKNIFNIEKDNKINEIKINVNELPFFRNYNILLIDDTDEFITYFERKIYFFKSILQDNSLSYKLIHTRDLNTYISAVSLKNGMILINLSNNLLICNLEDLVKTENFIQKASFTGNKITNVQIDDESIYLAYTSEDKILKLFNIEKLDKIAKIAELKFKENICEIVVSKKYVLVKFENQQFTSFIIIDKYKNDHKKRLEELIAYKKDFIQNQLDEDFSEHYLNDNFNSDLFNQNRAVANDKYLKYLENLRKDSNIFPFLFCTLKWFIMNENRKRVILALDLSGPVKVIYVDHLNQVWKSHNDSKKTRLFVRKLDELLKNDNFMHYSLYFPRNYNLFEDNVILRYYYSTNAEFFVKLKALIKRYWRHVTRPNTDYIAITGSDYESVKKLNNSWVRAGVPTKVVPKGCLTVFGAVCLCNKMRERQSKFQKYIKRNNKHGIVNFKDLDNSIAVFIYGGKCDNTFVIQNIEYSQNSVSNIIVNELSKNVLSSLDIINNLMDAESGNIRSLTENFVKHDANEFIVYKELIGENTSKLDTLLSRFLRDDRNDFDDTNYQKIKNLATLFQIKQILVCTPDFRFLPELAGDWLVNKVNDEFEVLRFKEEVFNHALGCLFNFEESQVILHFPQ